MSPRSRKAPLRRELRGLSRAEGRGLEIGALFSPLPSWATGFTHLPLCKLLILITLPRRKPGPIAPPASSIKSCAARQLPRHGSRPSPGWRKRANKAMAEEGMCEYGGFGEVASTVADDEQDRDLIEAVLNEAAGWRARYGDCSWGAWSEATIGARGGLWVGVRAGVQACLAGFWGPIAFADLVSVSPIGLGWQQILGRAGERLGRRCTAPDVDGAVRIDRCCLMRCRAGRVCAAAGWRA